MFTQNNYYFLNNFYNDFRENTLAIRESSESVRNELISFVTGCEILTNAVSFFVFAACVASYEIFFC